MAVNNDDGSGKSEPVSGGSIDDATDGNTGSTEQIDVVTDDTPPEPPNSVEVTEPPVSASEETSLSGTDDSRHKESPVPDTIEVSFGIPTNVDEIRDTADDQGETITNDSSITIDGNSTSDETIPREQDQIHQNETEDSPFPKLVDIPENTDDNEQSAETSSTESSSSSDELSAREDSTEESSTNTSSNSECDQKPQENEESPQDADTPAEPAPKISRKARRKQARKALREWQEMSFPNSIVDLDIPDQEANWSESLIDHEDPENIDDDSPSRKEWLRQKREEKQENKHLDRAMSIVGHEDVKAYFLYVKDRVEVAKRWREDLSQLKFDLILHGNRGIGKSPSALSLSVPFWSN